MAKKDLIDALDNPGAQIKKCSGELNKIFWKVVTHYNIGVRQVYDGIRNYVSDPINCEQTTNRRTEMRNNIIARITEDNITWFYLMRALRALQITRIELRIKLYRKGDKDTVEFTHDINLHHVTTYEGENTDDSTIDGAESVQTRRR